MLYHVYTGNSGTSARFLTGVVSVLKEEGGSVVVTGNKRMQQRPLKDMVDALRAHGCKIDYLAGDGCPPVRIHSCGLSGGTITMSATISSQFVSGILLASPLGQVDIPLLQHKHTHTHALTHTHTRCLSLSLTHAYIHTHTHTHTHTCTHTFSLSLALAHIHTHTHTHTFVVQIFLCCTMVAQNSIVCSLLNHPRKITISSQFVPGIQICEASKDSLSSGHCPQKSPTISDSFAKMTCNSRLPMGHRHPVVLALPLGQVDNPCCTAVVQKSLATPLSM